MNPRTMTGLCFFSSILLSLFPFSGNAASAGAPKKKLLMIGIDGIRPDALEAAETPNLDSLISDGSYSSTAQSEDLTFSGPNWSSILHGVHRDKHNVTSNGYENNTLSSTPDLFAFLENHDPTLDTARLTTWNAIFSLQPTGADIDLFRDYAQDGDNVATQWAVQLLSGTHPDYPGIDIDAVFLYLADVDVAGHSHGFHPTVPEYLAEIEDNDRQIGLVLDAMRNRPDFENEDWLVVLTSDHGGSIDGGHSGNTRERRAVPFLVSGPSTVKGTPFPSPRNLDGVSTSLAHFGIPLAGLDLDGKIVGLSPSAPPPVVFGSNLIFNGDAEVDRGFNDASIDQSISGWDDPGPDQMTVIRYGAPGGYPTPTSPGPVDRGENFFSGNSTGTNWMTQTLELAAVSSEIDAGNVRYQCSAYLGGFSGQDDRSLVRLFFLSDADDLLGTDQIGPVAAADRGSTTGLLYRESQTRGVPVGTRRVKVVLQAIFSGGSVTDGYADNLSFVLSQGSATPPPNPKPAPPAGTTEWRFVGDQGSVLHRAFGPGSLEYADGDDGPTDQADQFQVSDGTTIPHLAGIPTTHLAFAARTAATEGYLLRPGIDSPGDQGILQFTLIADLYVAPDNRDNWMGIWNASPTNTNDSEMFLRPLNEGYWTPSSATVGGSWRKGEWNRFVFVNDSSDTGTLVSFVNGIPNLEFATEAGDVVDDGDPNPFWILTDNSPSETSRGSIANLAFVPEALDATTIAALGKPKPGGIFSCLDLEVTPLLSGQSTTFRLSGGTPGTPVAVVFGLQGGAATFTNGSSWCGTFGFELPPLPLALSRIIGRGTFDANGEFSFSRNVPTGREGIEVFFQGTQAGTCPEECMSNLVRRVVE